LKGVTLCAEAELGAPPTDGEAEHSGLAVRQQREALGLSRSDVAARCCLSTKQVEQIEDGGHGAFYSASIKAHAQRRVLRWLAQREGWPRADALR
jgi:transcriptional regulator with XRE-family HTH domain